MRHNDLDSPTFRQRFAKVTVTPRSNKSRRRTYALEDSGTRFMLSVTPGTASAGPVEIEATTILSARGIPVPHVIDSFEDLGRHYLVQEYVDGIPLDDALKAADATESFRLGLIMGELLHALKSIPATEFTQLPASDGSWWDWLRKLDLPMPVELDSVQPRVTFVHNDFLPHNLILTSDRTAIAAVIDFEWSFIGDPVWDAGYLKWWFLQDDYPHSRECWSGVLSTLDEPFDDTLADFYASLRQPEDLKGWRNGLPPPICCTD